LERQPLIARIRNGGRKVENPQAETLWEHGCPLLSLRLAVFLQVERPRSKSSKSAVVQALIQFRIKSEMPRWGETMLLHGEAKVDKLSVS
jgi:hypothetical protein